MRRAVSGPSPLVARRAVALVFLLNAAAYANVVPRLPAIKVDLALSNTALGTAVAAMPVGALLAGPAAGWLVARVGSGRLAAGCGVGLGLVLPLFALAPAWWALAATFVVLGALDSVMDVAMNAHALDVQRRMGRSILSALHGLWSVGAVLGALAGAAAAGAGLALATHLVVAGATIAVLALLVPRWLLPHPGPDADVDAGPPEGDDAGRASAPPGRRGGAAPRLALLGLVVVMAAVIEDAPGSWGAVLLRTELGTSAAAAGLVFLGFQGAMTVSRLVGDRLVDRVGAVRLVRGGGLLTAGAVGAGLAVGHPAAVVAGFVLAGLGTAALFPLVFAAAGSIEGVDRGHGLAAVAWMGRVGFLVAPPLVGLVGDAVSVRAGLAVVPVAGLVVASLAGTLKPAETARHGGDEDARATARTIEEH